MTNPIIEVNQLSKRYKLGTLGGKSFYEGIKTNFNLFSSNQNFLDFKNRNTFLALDNVSFEVNSGDVLAIVGSNGAGKSTLLKILSKITQPSSGQAIIRGRVASLLEVGTGFHGELTGINNIYLSGALYGLSKKEIRNRLDEIIEFSQIGSFLETPVKRYSSGMYVRLAFSVAAFLNPEIIFLDEVLAVGDVAFRKKCLAKMKALSKDEGKTLLIVSHISSVVEQLATRAIWLDKGKIRELGNTKDILRSYHNNIDESNNDYLHDFEKEDIEKSSILKKYIHFGTSIYIKSNCKNTYIENLVIKNKSGSEKNVFETFDDILFSFSCACIKEEDSYIFFRILRDDGENIWYYKFAPEVLRPSDKHQSFSFLIRENHLSPGTYIFSLRIASDIRGLASSFPIEIIIKSSKFDNLISPMPEFRKTIPKVIID
jgi:ABC-type polysaccharide/polyol phosphate transport system ATPase subunit